MQNVTDQSISITAVKGYPGTVNQLYFSRRARARFWLWIMKDGPTKTGKYPG